MVKLQEGIRAVWNLATGLAMHLTPLIMVLDNLRDAGCVHHGKSVALHRQGGKALLRTHAACWGSAWVPCAAQAVLKRLGAGGAGGAGRDARRRLVH